MDYITSADVTNRLFNRQTEANKQIYIDMANDEIDDFAVRLGVKDPIVTPIHEKIKRYAVQYAISIFAEDNIGANNSNGISEQTDVYEGLFKRTRYILQNLKPEIVYVMFTGGVEDTVNRAVRSTRIMRV